MRSFRIRGSVHGKMGVLSGVRPRSSGGALSLEIGGHILRAQSPQLASDDIPTDRGGKPRWAIGYGEQRFGPATGIRKVPCLCNPPSGP
jgi:hypothetical protein